MIRVLAILFVLVSPKCLAEELAAVLDLKFIKDTGETAEVMCFGEAEEDCGTWATFYLFEAKVKKVISGDFPKNKFKVLFGAHALKVGNFKGVVATLKSLPEDHEARYQITEWGEEKEMYCFRAEEGEEYNVKQEPGGPDFRCYEKE
jgi:hypothetical protein